MEGISFIIFSSNNSDTIERSIQSIIQTIPYFVKNYSLTVFDESSADGTAGILNNLKDDNENLTVVYDMKDGIEIQYLFNQTGYEYYFILDGGIILEEKCIANLLKTLIKSEDILLAGAKVNLLNHTLKRAGRVHQVPLKKESDRSGIIRHTYWHLPDTLPLAQISSQSEIIKTMCYAIRVKDLHELFPDGTDLRELTLGELCLRIRSHGGKILYQPDSSVIKLHEHHPPGFLFRLTKYDSLISSNIPDLEEEMERIRKDLEIALAEKRIEEVFSTGIVGFKGYFSLDQIRGKILKGKIQIKKNSNKGRIIFPELTFKQQVNLIIKAEVESQENTTLCLKYKTKSDPEYSFKNSYYSEVFRGKQLVLFSFASDHLLGRLCFEFSDLIKDFTINSVKVFSYHNPRWIKSLVTVVIPCFNQGEFLEEALQSLNNIDSSKYEVIIVDDGSDDPLTLEKLKELEYRGYYIHHQENSGLGAARNVGIRLANGNYILPLDSDNKIRPVYIEKGIEILDMHPEVGVVYGNVQRFGDSDSLVVVPEFDPVRILVENTIDACALFRKEIWEQVGGYEENMVGYQDWAFWMAIAATENWEFFHIDDIVFDYRIRQGSMVSNTKRYHFEMLDHMLTRNISFFRREFQQFYKQVPHNRGFNGKNGLSGHETLLGSIRLHLRHFFLTRFKNKSSN